MTTWWIRKKVGLKENTQFESAMLTHKRKKSPTRDGKIICNKEKGEKKRTRRTKDCVGKCEGEGGGLLGERGERKEEKKVKN